MCVLINRMRLLGPLSQIFPEGRFWGIEVKKSSPGPERAKMDAMSWAQGGLS